MTSCKKACSVIPGAKLAVIDGAGHLPNMEEPELFNKVLDDFLAVVRLT